MLLTYNIIQWEAVQAAVASGYSPTDMNFKRPVGILQCS